jgi:hypothetical protein
VCTTARSGLGQPIIDNQASIGIRVAQESPPGVYPERLARLSHRGGDDHRLQQELRGATAASNTSTAPRRDRSRRFRTARTGALPANIAMTTTLDGDTVPYIVRWERGTINRFIYSVAMLAPTTETNPLAPDDSLWNGRLVFSLEGGVAIGHTQGTIGGGAALERHVLQLGYAVVSSSGLRTNTHYNLQLGGETALMLKEHFIENHGVRSTPSASAGRAARSSSTCTRRTIRACSTRRSRSTRTPTWSRRRSTSGTASCSSTTSTSPTQS